MIQVLYVLNFTPPHFEAACLRLECSVKSIFNDDVEIVVFNGSEEGITNEYLLDCSKVKIYHKHCPGYFNKSKLINYAVKNYINTEFFIFSDIDLVYQSRYIQGMCGYISNSVYNRVIPWNNNIYNLLYSSSYDELMTLEKDHKGGYAHGNGLIHKPSFMKIRGYNEKFLGYGPEDDEMNTRLGKINNLIYTDTLRSAHIYHLRLNIDYRANNTLLLHAVRDKVRHMRDNDSRNDIRKLQENPANWGDL